MIEKSFSALKRTSTASTEFGVLIKQRLMCVENKQAPLQCMGTHNPYEVTEHESNSRRSMYGVL
jgi:hypothetical protein